MSNRIYLVILLLFIFSCKSNQEKKTPSGLRYIVYNTPAAGKKIEKGDYVTLVMTYRDDRDSILYDSKSSGSNLRFQLDKIPFAGSFEEGLTLLTKGDSATFFVSADSMYNSLFVKRNSKVSQDQTAFRKKSFVRFDVRILNVQEMLDAEMEMALQISSEERKEKGLINKYVSDHSITVPQNIAGYYLIMKEQGKGAPVDSGKIVTIEYEGRFLDNTVFDGTKKAGRPYHFMSGAHQVITGWELVMKNMREGDKFTLLLPSKLAYGSEGIKNPVTGKFIVPPFSPVVFDISIESVEEMPSVTGR